MNTFELRNKKMSFYTYIILSVILLIGCEKKTINGSYFDLNNHQIFEFRKSELLINNIKDSIQNKYSFEVGKDIIILNDKDKTMNLHYEIDQDSLYLVDVEHNISNDDEIKLIRLNFGNIYKPDLFANNYWEISSKMMKNDYWIKCNIIKNDKHAFMYGIEENSKHLFLESSFCKLPQIRTA